MNVIMALNRSVTEAGGNFGLLQVRPEVIQILQKAGIANALRIFNSDDEVESFSMSLMQNQQQGFAQQPQQSQSEFDQLRSEIGSVFGGPEQPLQDFGNQGYAQQQQPRQPSRPMQQPQSPYARPGFPTQQPQFQGRQFTPPPPPPLTPSRPIVPPPVQTGGISGPQKPPVRPPFSTDQSRMGSQQQQEFTPEMQGFPQASQIPVQPKKAESPISSSFSDELEGIAPKTGKFRTELSSARADAIDNEDDILSDDMQKKKSPVGIIVVVLLLIALAGAGYYAVTSGLINLGGKSQSTTQKPAETKPVATQAPATPPQAPIELEPTPPPPALEPVKPEPPKAEPPRQVPVKKESTAPKRVAQRPAKAPVAAAQQASANKLVITSTPAGAFISVNGEMIGKTPYTWDKPVFGPISIELSRAGYKSTSRDIEFTGGSISENFILDRELPPPPPKAEPVVEPEPETRRPEPVVTSTPEPVSTPVAPVSTPKPSKPAVSTPAASTPVASSAGGDASIYFASLPPIAEVYLNGKLVGRTNVAELKLPSGTHVLRFVKGPKEVTQEITLQPGKNPSRLIRLP